MITKEEAIEMLENLEDCIIKAKTYSAIERSQMFEQIKQALHSQPPTEEEVCEALSEWFDMEWSTLYDLINEHAPLRVDEHHKNIFYPRELYTASPGKALKLPNSIGITKGEIYGVENLPPHLITIVGQFYESRNKQ